MKTFKVWATEYEEESQATEIETYIHGRAAEKFAENTKVDFDNDEIHVSVKLLPEDEIQKYVVNRYRGGWEYEASPI